MEAGATLFAGRTRNARVHRRAHFSLRRSDRRHDHDVGMGRAGGRFRGREPTGGVMLHASMAQCVSYRHANAALFPGVGIASL